jgi:uncharacterized protein (DUF1697 family)
MWNARKMPGYVALLRGINVGGRNRVAMADLRQLTEALGHTEVATYIQSGNVLFASPDTDCGVLADVLEQAIARSLAVRPAAARHPPRRTTSTYVDSTYVGSRNQ